MAPFLQILSRDDILDDNKSTPTPLTPEDIGGIAFAGALVLAVSLWLAIRSYRQRARKRLADGERQGAVLTVEGLTTEGDDKAAPPRVTQAIDGPLFSREQLTASIIMPHQNIIRPDVTEEEILRYHAETGTMTSPFSNAASSTNAPPFSFGRPVSTVSSLTAAGGDTSPRRGSPFGLVGSRLTSSTSTL
ncbi:hypothetical protein EI94DRAFT_617354 [Lactarius quietus]|nr:hypothetical protein EI94DRAFT_617354 [Lactarius quietus]